MVFKTTDWKTLLQKKKSKYMAKVAFMVKIVGE